MARRLLASSAFVAVGTLFGNVLSYGFSFVAAQKLDKTGYGQIGTLLMIFLVASIPATAIQAVAARRVARSGSTDPAVLRELTSPLVRWSLVIGVVEAALLAALSPAVSAALPAISTAGVAWTALALIPSSLIFCYFGIAQGSSRFTMYTALFLVMNGAKLVAGVGAALVTGNPGQIIGAMAVSWFVTAAICHYMLRDVIGRPRLARNTGYAREVSTASWSLGAVLVLSILDGLLSAHYFSGDVLGRYQVGAMFTRAGYFGPQFAGILAYPRLAQPETRRAALRKAMALTIGIGALMVVISALAATPMIKIAFGAKYLTGTGFDLSAAAWLFALSGAVQAVVQLALLDAVARRSAVIGWLVFGGIVVEAAAILSFAHHSATELIATAASCGTLTAIVAMTVAALATHHAAAHEPATTATPEQYAAASS